MNDSADNVSSDTRTMDIELIEASPSLDELQFDLLARYGRPQTSIDDLPAELRRQLLLVLDFDSLKALVHASPTYRQQYLLDRRFILVELLRKSLHTVLIDACAVHLASQVGWSTRRTNKSVSKFLDDYRIQHSKRKEYRTITDCLEENTIVAMVNFHFTIVAPMIKICAAMGMAEVGLRLNPDPENKCKRPEQISLSKSEEFRFARGFYRYELACLLFGSGPYMQSRPNDLNVNGDQILDSFLTIYEPWEVEEINCVTAFVDDNIRYDLHDLLHEPEDLQCCCEDPDAMEELRTIVQGQATRGLRCALYYVRGQSDDILDEEDGGFSQLFGQASEHDFLCDAWLPDTQLAYRKQASQPSERDLKEENREPMVFQGDLMTETAYGNAPFAWHLLWKDTYSNCFGQFLCPQLRRCCYVMWDAETIENDNFDGLFSEHLECHGGDPRDYVQHVMYH